MLLSPNGGTEVTVRGAREIDHYLRKGFTVKDIVYPESGPVLPVAEPTDSAAASTADDEAAREKSELRRGRKRR